MHLLRTLSLSLLLAAAACESARFDHVELYEIEGSPGAKITTAIIVPEGGVVVFEAYPRAESASREYEGLERFKLRSSDDDVADVHRAILRDAWVVSGMARGSTSLKVLVDDELVDTIPVEIVEEGQ